VLTLFTIPKPFAGAARTAQLNALRSWRALDGEVEILVFGDEAGAAEAAAETGAVHVPDVARNEWGTPLVADAFDRAARAARHETLAYANADMILFDDLLTAVRRLHGRRALLFGRRTDVHLGEELSFDDGGARLRALAAGGQLGTERQIDYLVFRRDVQWEMPPFAVGRPGWDNWMLLRARDLDLDLVDLTPSVLALHQAHGYDHVPARRDHRWGGPEADRNRELAGIDPDRAFGILDATHVLGRHRLLPALGPRHLKRRARRSSTLGPVVRNLERLARR
jgi:hypothetical protein